jgi:hypothetical protein
MKEITEKQYEEYKALKRWAKREKVWVSVNGIQNLEDDVDAPIKKCVAMCALLGLEPVFSCCGFDYHGQPYHKSHQYGEAYITLKKNRISEHWLTMGTGGKLIGGWVIRKHVQGTLALIHKVPGNPYWRKRDCIHFAEETALGIAYLERALLGLSENFFPAIVLEDTNQNYKKSGVRHWQYPPKKPWVIKKDLLDTY